MPSKRKRAPTITDVPATEAVQPSSRDASGEDTADPILDDVKARKEQTESRDDPPAKRTRSTSKVDKDAEKDAEMQDAANGSDESGFGSGEGGEAGTMKMKAPPKAGLVDPVGYHTNPPPEGREVRVYADGVFDLFHLGHMRQLQQAKTAFPNTYLLVGVTGDRETHRRKGLTVLSAKERAESVRHCKWVDEVVEDCPWVVDVDFLNQHKIDYVAHDDIPYGADEGDDIYKPVKEQGKFLVTQRTEGVSTTGIITKIVRDYEAYIKRQLKRGTTRQELNISWMKKNELDIKRHVTEIRDNIRTNWTTTGQELGKEFRQFWQPSRQNSPGPGSLQDTSRRRGRQSDVSLAMSMSSPTLGGERGAQSPGGWSRLTIPGNAGGRHSDFVAGYAMGLIGSVRGWMQRDRRNINESRPASPPSGGSDEEERDDVSLKSPTIEVEDTNGDENRGRKRKTRSSA